jgi:hypothetical protein
MINKTEKYQNIYLKILKEKLFETSSFDETKFHLTSELIEIEVIFVSHISSPLTHYTSATILKAIKF